jgi:hypothetical protein
MYTVIHRKKNYLENNNRLICSTTLNAETTSPGLMDKLKRIDKYYVGLLMLCALWLIKDFLSGTMIGRSDF